MKAHIRNGLLGAAAAVIVIGIVVVISFSGPTPLGGEGDRLMALSIRLTELGAPFGLLVVELADFIGAESQGFALVYLLLLVSILIEWALAGIVIGWIVKRVRVAF